MEENASVPLDETQAFLTRPPNETDSYNPNDAAKVIESHPGINSVGLAAMLGIDPTLIDYFTNDLIRRSRKLGIGEVNGGWMHHSQSEEVREMIENDVSTSRPSASEREMKENIMDSHSTESRGTGRTLRFALPVGAIINPLEALSPATGAALVAKTRTLLENALRSFSPADDSGTRA